MTMFLFKKDEVINRIDNLIKFVETGN
jgi:hypothetical protein